MLVRLLYRVLRRYGQSSLPQVPAESTTRACDTSAPWYAGSTHRGQAGIAVSIGTATLPL